MKKYLCATRIVLSLAFVACSILVFSFRQKDKVATDSFRTPRTAGEDTTAPGKRNRNADEFRLEQLDKAMQQLDLKMAEMDIKMKQLDFSKMEKEINASINKIDFKKIEKDVEASMKKVDWEKMNAELQESMAKLSSVDMEKIRESVEKAKVEVNAARIRVNIDTKKINEDVQRSLEGARKAIEKSKDEIKSYNDLTDALQKDGLIDKSKGYRVELKDGSLYLNGKKQSKEVTDKYNKFYKKDNFSINRGDSNDVI